MIPLFIQRTLSILMVVFTLPGWGFLSTSMLGHVNDSDCSAIPIPGGGTITFSSNRNGIFQIYVIDGDECHHQQLTNDNSRNTNPVWNNNGDKLAFISNDYIYTMNVDGSNKTLLSPPPGSYQDFQASPSWSPDGSQIAFQANSAAVKQEIFVINVDRTNLRQLTNKGGPDNVAPSWSSDGTQIAYVSQIGELWVMNADGSSGQSIMSDKPLEVNHIAWSPDGTKIAFDECGHMGVDCQIYLINPDGSNKVRLTNDGNNNTSPQWSPDSNRLVFTSDRDSNLEIYVMDANGDNQTRVTNNSFSDSYPVWGGPSVPVNEPPVTTIALNPEKANGQNGWYVSNVHALVSAVSSLGDVTETRCVLDPENTPLNFEDIPGGCVYTDSGADITLSGQHELYAASSDNYSKETPVNKFFKIDTILPVITASLTPLTPDSTGWYNGATGAPIVNFNCADGESGIDPGDCPASHSFGEGDNQSFSAVVTDLAGNTSISTEVNNIRVDLTPPDLNPVISSNTIILNGSATISTGAEDNLSGVSSQSCDSIDTSSVGTKTVTCTATDNAGNTSSKSVSYNVIYQFDGFLPPINDTAHQTCSGCSTSIFKGNSTVPVKFQLKDANGNIVQTGSLPLWVTPQQGGVITAAVDESLYSDPVASGVTFDLKGNHYAYNWKTKSYATGYYWRIGVKLDDGQVYYVNIGLR
jgi:Tol biopolymer transport system component